MTKKYLSLEKIPEIESILKRVGSLANTCLETGFTRSQILRLLQHKYQTNAWQKIKKAMCLKKPLSSLQKEKIFTAKKLYDELGTLEAAGKALSITRERVRQLLILGVNHGLFEYTLVRDKYFERLLARFPREKIAATIKQFPSPSEVAEKFGLKVSELNKLMEHYSINAHEHSLAAKKRRYIEQYTKMVSELGYHPATTEMQKKPEWRSAWAGISRLWGNMGNFRREFGIVPNLARRTEHMRMLGKKFGGNSGWKEKIQAFQKTRREEKDRKKHQILELLGKNNSLFFSQIQAHANISDGTLYRYLSEMIAEKSIVRHGSGNQVRYSLPGVVVEPPPKFEAPQKRSDSLRWLRKPEVLSCFDDNGKAFSSAEIARLLGRNRFICWKILKSLCLERKLVRIGSGKNVKYCLPEYQIPVGMTEGSRQKRTENILLLFGKEAAPLSLKQIAAKLDLTDKMSWPVLKKLQNEKKIIKVGSGKDTRYALAGTIIFEDRSAKAKREKVLSQFNNSDILSLPELVRLTGYSTCACWKALKELWLENKITKVGRGNRVKYKLNNPQNLSVIAEMREETMNQELEDVGRKESKEAKFRRLAERRINAALDKIRLIGNLASPQYSFAPEQVDKMVLALQEAVSEVENKFKKPLERKKKKFEF